MKDSLDQEERNSGEVEASSEEEAIGMHRTISILASEIVVPLPASEAEVREVVLRAEISVAVASGVGHWPI